MNAKRRHRRRYRRAAAQPKTRALPWRPRPKHLGFDDRGWTWRGRPVGERHRMVEAALRGVA
jgi:hypothetical protein